MVLVAFVPAAIITFLLLVIGWISFQESVTNATLTLRHYLELYTDDVAYRSFLNTLGFAFVTLAVAMSIGIPMAWLVTRTDLPGSNVILTATTLGVLIPGFFTAMGWLFMFHPRIGLFNQAAKGIGFNDPIVNILSIPAMGFVQGLNLAALVFVLTSAGLRSMDASLEEAALASGASFLGTLRRITAPLAFPAILAAALYVFTIGIGAFDIPAIIGLSNRILTFSTYLYLETHPTGAPPNYGAPAAFSTFMVLVALLLSWWYSRVLVKARKYQIVTGKNYKPRRISLGRWSIAAWTFLGAYMLFALILPLVMLAWTALLPFIQLPSAEAFRALSFRNFAGLPWQLVSRGVGHTIVLAVIAPALTLVLSVVLSWVVLRSRSRYRLAFDFVAFLPHAVPAIVFGLGALVVSLFLLGGIGLYGSLTLLVVVFAVVHISFGTRVTNSALINIHPELEEAAEMAGAARLAILWKVVMPLLWPALLYAGLWLALLSIRELTLASMLFSPKNITLSVVIWSLFSGGQTGQSAAVGMMLILVLLPFVVGYWRFGARYDRSNP